MGKESACQCGRHRRCWFYPWVRKIPWRREWQHSPAFLLGESHGQRSLAGYSPKGCKESDTTGWLSTHTWQNGQSVTQWKSLQQKRLGAKMSTAKTLQENRWTHFKPGLENTKNRKRWGWIVGQGLVHVKPWQCKSFAVICHNEQCSKDRSVSEVSPLT